MTPSESKTSSDDAQYILAKFADWGTSPDLTDKIERFMQESCESMKDASLDCEQDLEWTSLHAEYVDMIETEMESFCKEHETSEEEVFQMIADINSGRSIDEDNEEFVKIEEDFVPEVIKLCDYPQFLIAMRETALISTNNRIAREEERRAEEEGIRFNLSGCYFPRSELIEKNQVNSYYIYTKCPWYFRKLFVAATHNIKDLTIQHEEDTFTILYTMPFFGRKKKQYRKDGQVHTVTNTWGKEQATTCYEEEGKRIVIRVDNPAYAPDGYTTNTFEFSDNSEGIKTVHWKRRIYLDKDTHEPAIDADGNHAGTDLFCASSRTSRK